MFSKRDLGGVDPIAMEYMECVNDIIHNKRIEKLVDHCQHYNTTRLQHCINVSYYSFRICRFFGWNKTAAARAGLMHDLYYYDWRIKNSFRKMSHPKWHPLVAKDNARKICNLNPVEEDAILKHMWPMTFSFPKYKESFVVSMTDKGCAALECVVGGFLNLK